MSADADGADVDGDVAYLDVLRVGFPATMTALFVVIIAVSTRYRPDSRLIPLVISIPTFLLFLVITLSNFSERIDRLLSAFQRATLDIDPDVGEDGEEEGPAIRRDGITRAFLWGTGLLAGLLLFGMIPIFLVFTYVFLIREGGHGRHVSAAIAVLSTVAVAGLFEYVLSTPLYPGLVVEFLVEFV